MESLFPTPNSLNFGIDVVAPRTEILPAALMVNAIPDIALFSYAGVFFPRYYYEAADDGLFASLEGLETIDGFVKKDNLSDEALAHFRKTYGDETISKDDVFYYVYGMLHSPQYREVFGASLKKVLPRIPLTAAFAEFTKAGEALSQMHLDFENVSVYELNISEVADKNLPLEKLRYRRNGKSTDKSVIIYNSKVSLSGIPERAHDYKIGSRSALDWLVDRYQVKADAASGIVNDPNQWAKEQGNPDYIIDLVGRVVTISLETQKIVESLPPLEIIE
jgi:predicted helicase